VKSLARKPRTEIEKARAESQEAANSLDVVQRMVVSALIAVITMLPTGVLSFYLATRGQQDLHVDQLIGLWIMSGIMGLTSAAAILAVNHRHPYNPAVLLGLVPMAITAFWVLF
jgi:hypothetical protein